MKPRNKNTGGSGSGASSPSDMEARALIVALEMLRKTVADSPLAQPPKAPGEVDKKDKADPKAGLLGNSMTMLIAKFAAVIGPLAILSAVLSSNASGFQVLGSAVKVLAATLGPVLLPVVAVLAAMFVYCADLIWAKLLPALEGWYTYVMTELVPGLQNFAQGIEKLVPFLIRFAQELASLITRIVGFAAELNPFASAEEGARADEVAAAKAMDMTNDEIRTQARAAKWSETEIDKAFETVKTRGEVGEVASKFGIDRDAGGFGGSGSVADVAIAAARAAKTGPGGGMAAGAVEAAGGSGDMGGVGAAVVAAIEAAGKGEAGAAATKGGGFGGAMGDVLKELQMSMGPKAQMSGLAAASRNVQMAALNASPMEAKMFERMGTVVELLNKVAHNTGVTGVAH